MAVLEGEAAVAKQREALQLMEREEGNMRQRVGQRDTAARCASAPPGTLPLTNCQLSRTLPP